MSMFDIVSGGPMFRPAGPNRVQREQSVSGFQCLDNETSGTRLLHIYSGFYWHEPSVDDIQCVTWGGLIFVLRSCHSMYTVNFFRLTGAQLGRLNRNRANCHLWMSPVRAPKISVRGFYETVHHIIRVSSGDTNYANSISPSCFGNLWCINLSF